MRKINAKGASLTASVIKEDARSALLARKSSVQSQVGVGNKILHLIGTAKQQSHFPQYRQRTDVLSNF